MKNEKFLYLVSCIASKVQNLFVKRSFEPRSILIVKLDEIGDMIYALHILDHLKKQYPNALLNVYCKPFNNSLIKNTGIADRIINEFDELDKSYDLLVHLRGSWSTFWYGFKCKMRLERGCVRLGNKLSGGQTHEVDTNFNIIRSILTEGTAMSNPAIRLTIKDVEEAEKLISKENLQKFAIMHTGARDLSRRWPAERFALLADWLYESYQLEIVFGGGPGEWEDIEKIRSLCKVPTFNFAGKTSLTGFAALCDKAQIFIGNESGPMHIANVMNTPLVALFGPGVKDVFYPYGENVQVIHHFKASGHTNQTTADSTIYLITIDEVKEAVRKLLKAGD